MTEYLVNETEFLPWFAGDRGLEYINIMLTDTANYVDFREYMRNIARPSYYALGWSASEDYNDIINE